MPTVIIPDKICSHCGGTKWIIEKENRKYGLRTRYRCAIRASERYKRWTVNHPDKVLYYSKESSKVRTECGHWKTEEYKKQQLLRYYENRDQVTDRFVKHILAHDGLLSQSDIPQNLVELKRKQLLLTRQIKNHEGKDYTLY
jgi:hypothetical protein